MPSAISLASRDDLPVRHAHAAVRRAAGDQLRLVGAVDAHDAAARPVGQRVRVGRRAERPRTVDRAPAQVPEPLAHPELPLRRDRAGRADADPRAPHLLAALAQRGGERSPVDRQVRLDLLEVRELLLPHPARPAVRPARDADLQPDPLVVVEPGLQHDVDLGQAVLGVPAQLRDRAAARRRLGAHLADQVRVRPPGDGGLVREALVAERRVVALLAQRRCRGRRGGRGRRERGDEEGDGKEPASHVRPDSRPRISR